ncbi:hypothetical protein LTR66_007415 [Elasticomyces elasticus]|nr:hypothetical protein LTR66_007415 [Elasticomyces elasticus]
MPAQELSHNQIWDDSALLESWDEVLEEYKYYHSIAARGENVEEIMEAAIKQESKEFVAHNFIVYVDTNRSSHEQELLNGQLSNGVQGSSNGVSGSANHPSSPNRTQASSGTFQAQSGIHPDAATAHIPTTQGAAAGASGMADMPTALVGRVQDENLKNLMMSWYYAGYYTGLFEGQQNTSAAHAPAPVIKTEPAIKREDR